MDAPQTLIEAVRYFSDLDLCEEYMRAMRWRGGKPKCPECGSDNVGANALAGLSAKRTGP